MRSNLSDGSEKCQNLDVFAIPVKVGIQLILLFIFLNIVCSSTSLAEAASVYCVRSGATGASDGSDWNNAFIDLPVSMIRGATYYVADGIYTGHAFSATESGTEQISIVKAIPSVHGVSIGWLDEYGDGEAEFGALTFSTGYWIFDGVTGGGVGKWKSGYGFKIAARSDNNEWLLRFRTNGSNNVISHVDIGNTSAPGPGCDVAIYSSEGADNNTISYCYIHHIGDIGLFPINSSGWIIQYSRLDRLGEMGTVPASCGGGNNHGAGIVFSGTTTNATLRYNLMSNSYGTGWIGIYDTGTGYVDGLYIYGNVFFNTSDYSGTWGNGIVYNVSGTTEPIKNIKIYNNTFANLNSPGIIGLTKDLGQTRAHAGSTGNEFVNNIVYNVSGTPFYTINIKSFNASDEDIGGDSNVQILTSNPFVGPSSEDFRLVAATIAGYSLVSPYDKDMYGELRGAKGVWDRGSFEYSIGLLRPVGLRTILP